jgi:acyl-coenzyme A synthetase/AMP-(fatty) acid ligase
VIALLGPSDLEFMITMFALSRLGYTILILSPRLAIEAHVALLKVTGCSTLCYASTLEPTVHTIQKTEKLRTLKILNRSDFEHSENETPLLRIKDELTEMRHKIAFIMHSSGSTGLPKPIFQTHEACLENYAMGHEMRGFLTVPLYHTHGHACLYRAIYNRATLYFLNANLPVISTNLITVMEHARPEVIYTVPYALKLLAESEQGIQALQDCKLVSSSGSQIPDDLGDRLVDNGIQLVSQWGS